ncbi:MAG: hypothetical protein LBV19_03145 [Streptococcaceae bacterium]|jgi:hypothetical protein|nr:hypothetical protein [Streptococcaceae bacterium]
MKEINLLIVGAVISLVATTIGYVAQTIIQVNLDGRGKVNIYVKSVYNKTTQSAWGFDSNGVFNVPLWIEIHNTKNKNEIVRNVNLQLYLEAEKVGKTIQISHSESKGNKNFYGNDGAYSFLIGSCTILRYDLDFCAKQSEIKSNFDEVRISYFDSKNVYREYKLFDVENCWRSSNNKIDNDWHLLK